MSKTVFLNGTVVPADWFNSIQNLQFTGLDFNGEYAKITDNDLTDVVGNLKPEVYSYLDSLKVVVDGGLVVKVLPGSVVSQQGVVTSFSERFITMPESSTEFIFVTQTSTITRSSSIPSSGVLLASVSTNATEVLNIIDLRPRRNYQISPITIPAQPQFTMPPGVVVPYFGNSAPSGWLLCDGGFYSVNAFPNLHSVIGYSYGGSGETFRVPDLRGQLLRGKKGAETLGSKRGSETVTLSSGNLPNHTHSVNESAHRHPKTDNGHSHALTMLPHNHNVNVTQTPHRHRIWAWSDPNKHEGENDSLVWNGLAGISGEVGILGEAELGASYIDYNEYFNPPQQPPYIEDSIINLTVSLDIATVQGTASNSSSGVSFGSTKTGITINPTGNNAPLSIVNPNTSVNYIIKV